MSRTNRYIESGKPYELCLRVAEGLPFACLLFIKLLLKSAMARALRGNRVTVCHFVWMTNHLHILIVVHDAGDAVMFYGELQKRLTDYMKRVLGVKRLKLWEGGAMVARVYTLDTAMARIAYFYANPSRANLVDRIEDYPGLSSFREFQKASSLNSTFSTEVPWIRVPAVPKVGARSVTRRADRKLYQKLSLSTSNTNSLTINPNAWMLCFGCKESDVAGINADIVERLLYLERGSRASRNAKGHKPLGAALLREASIMRAHTPKKKERKIFVLCTDKELRLEFIQRVKALQEYCRTLFKKKLFHLWPPGMFRPPAGHLASAVELI